MTPDMYRPLLDMLRTAMGRHDRNAVNDSVAKLLKARAPLGVQWKSLATLMAFHGELRLGREAIDAFVQAAGGSPTALFEQAAYLAEIGDPTSADAVLARLPTSVPTRLTHAHFRGVLAMERGDNATARHQFEMALAQNPRSGPTWLSIAMSTDLNHDDIGDRLLGTRLDASEASSEDRAQLEYAHGKAYADRGQFAQAFAAVSRGAALVKPQRFYDPRADRAAAEPVLCGFPNGSIEKLAARTTIDTSRPIFVTGSPRSGTTLVEQVLVSHRDVCGGAELGKFQLVAADIGGMTARHVQDYAESGNAIDVAAASYLRLLEERFGRSGRVVDKTLDQGRLVGLIASILPSAPIIWVVRNSLDRAWSCFRTYFAHSVGWSHDLIDIADHFRIEEELLAFWKNRLGERLLIVPYEELVETPEQWIDTILKYCDLPADPATLTPHKTERSVTTSSVNQVRRPINREAVGNAEPYRAFLQPFTDTYGRR